MIVKCIQLPEEEDEYVSHLTLHNDYFVMALNFEAGVAQYCVVDDQSDETNMPVWYSAKLFEITDSRIPHEWHIGKEDDGLVLGFKEWADSDGEFYYWLVEDREKELSLYREYVKKLKEEHKGQS